MNKIIQEPWEVPTRAEWTAWKKRNDGNLCLLAYFAFVGLSVAGIIYLFSMAP